MYDTIDSVLDYQHLLEGQRSTWDSTWQDVVDYCLPFRERVTVTDTPGDVWHARIMYNSTPMESINRLAASINSTLTNQSSEWFRLTTDDDEVNEEQDVKEWLDLVTDIVAREFTNSNFYTEVNEMYVDDASFGTGCLYIEESNKVDYNLNFSSRHMKEIYLDEDDQGRVDTVFRKFKMTAVQMIKRWGEDGVSKNVKKAYNGSNKNEEFDVLHCVYPREEYDPDKIDTENMKFESRWIEVDNKHELETSGYRTFPYVVPRWTKSSGEKYGRSPAINMLPDIKTLNLMEETFIKTGQKIADPPLQVPDEGFEDVSLKPGDVNYYRSGTTDRIEPLDLGANMPLTHEMIERKEDAIRDAFLVTQLQIIDKSRMTAAEVRIRQEENMRILGPTFGRMQFEFLEPLLDRVLDILNQVVDDDGTPLIPEAPEVVQGKKLRLRFVSPLARAQRMDDMVAINQSLQVAGAMAQMDATVLDNLNLDVAIRRIVELNGAPTSILRDEKEVQAIREQRRVIAEQQRLIENAETASKVDRNEAAALEKMEGL